MLLPHITCVKQNLYIGNRLADRLTKNQSVFLQQCSGRLRFTEIVQQNNIEIAGILHLCRYLLWWPNALNGWENETVQCRRLIFSAGAEMPWLAMGGRILAEAPQYSTILVNCFSSGGNENNTTLYNGPAEYLLACDDEAVWAARLAGAGYMNWNLSAQKTEAFQGAAENGLFREKIQTIITRSGAGEIFIPASLEKKIETELVHDAVLALAAEGYIQADIHIYEDAPSSLGQRLADEFYAKFEGAYLAPEEYYTDTSATVTAKSILLQLFRCMIAGDAKTMWAEAGIRNAEIWGNPQATVAERFWQLNFSGMM